MFRLICFMNFVALTFFIFNPVELTFSLTSARTIYRQNIRVSVAPQQLKLFWFACGWFLRHWHTMMLIRFSF